MVSGKPPTIRDKLLALIEKSGRNGIYQRDLQKALGISKSYCSEQLAYLSGHENIIAKRKEGGLVKIYHLEYFPGIIDHVIRVGMLRSSEYVPAIAKFDEVFGSAGHRIFYRFYNGTRGLFQDFNSKTLEFILAPTQALIMSGIMEDNLAILSGLASGGSGIISQKIGRRAILSTELSSMISLASESMAHELPGEIESYEDPKAALSDYLAGKCEMIAIWEPYFSYLLEKPGNTIIIGYREVLGDFPCCSAAVSQQYYQIMKKRVDSWVAEYRKMKGPIDFNLPRFEEAIRRVAEGTGMERSLVETSLETYDFNHNSISSDKLVKLGIKLSARQKERLFSPEVLSE